MKTKEHGLMYPGYQSQKNQKQKGEREGHMTEHIKSEFSKETSAK